MNKNKDSYRKSKHSIVEVFEYARAAPVHGQKVKFHGDYMHMRTPSILNFLYNGITCCRCGKRGAFFSKEKENSNSNIWHLNLYTFDKRGNELIMTWDHIRPVSKGGSDSLSNAQAMCWNCNNSKANHWGIKDRIKYALNKIKFFLFVRD